LDIITITIRKKKKKSFGKNTEVSFGSGEVQAKLKFELQLTACHLPDCAKRTAQFATGSL